VDNDSSPSRSNKVPHSTWTSNKRLTDVQLVRHGYPWEVRMHPLAIHGTYILCSNVRRKYVHRTSFGHRVDKYGYAKTSISDQQMSFERTMDIWWVNYGTSNECPIQVSYGHSLNKNTVRASKSTQI